MSEYTSREVAFRYVTMAQEMRELRQQMECHLKQRVEVSDVIAAWTAEKNERRLDAAREGGEK